MIFLCSIPAREKGFYALLMPKTRPLEKIRLFENRVNMFKPLGVQELPAVRALVFFAIAQAICTVYVYQIKFVTMKDNFYVFLYIKRKMVQKKWLEGESLDSDENVAKNTPF
jgi:hypothetical protein